MPSPKEIRSGIGILALMVTAQFLEEERRERCSKKQNDLE
jgi:hypothetical protein